MQQGEPVVTQYVRYKEGSSTGSSMETPVDPESYDPEKDSMNKVGWKSDKNDPFAPKNISIKHGDHLKEYDELRMAFKIDIKIS